MYEKIAKLTGFIFAKNISKKSGRVPKSKSFYAYKVKKKDFSFGVVRPPTGRLIGS